MNLARYEELERAQNGVARKVLDIVPQQEAWTAQQIHSESARLGRHLERRVLDGCLIKLVEAGLVREPQPGRFQRVTPRPTLVRTEAHEAPPVVDSPAPPGPMERRAALAAELRQLSADAEALATRVDDVAVEVEEEMQKLREEGGNLRKLKDLLKSLD